METNKIETTESKIKALLSSAIKGTHEHDKLTAFYDECIWWRADGLGSSLSFLAHQVEACFKEDEPDYNEALETLNLLNRNY